MGSDNQKVSVIIPVHNEQWSIFPLHGKLMGVVENNNYQWEILFVDDGSGDGTLFNIIELTKSDSRVKCISLYHHFGLTQALQSGFANVTGDIVVTMSGNLQHDPIDIIRLLEKLDEGFDVCAGWRNTLEGKLKRDRPGKVMNWIISWISGVKLHDYECLFRAYRASILLNMQLFGNLERYIPVYLSWKGGRITEIPVTQHPRSHGAKRRESPTKKTLKTILDLILLKYLERFSFRPFYVFGLLGLIGVLGSLTVGGLMLYLKYANGVSFIETPLPLLAVFFFLSGIGMISLGFVAEFLVRISQLATDRSGNLVRETHGY